MSSNLLEILKEYFSGDVISNLAAIIGEPPANTETALQKALPSLVAGLAENSSDAIFNLLSQDSHDGSILSNLGALSRGGDESNKLITEGKNQLASLFGAKSGEVSDLIANSSGISKNASTSLLGFITPVVLGLIGKTLKLSNTDNASGLADLLTEQKVLLKDQVPAGLSDLLTENVDKPSIAPYTIEIGDKPEDVSDTFTVSQPENDTLTKTGDEIEQAAEQTLASAKHIVEGLGETTGQFGQSMAQESMQFANSHADNFEEGAGEGGKFLPWLLILAAIALMWGLLRSCSVPEPEDTAPKLSDQAAIEPQPTPVPAPSVPPAESLAKTPAEPSKTDTPAPVVAPQSSFEKSLSTGYSIKAAKDGFESKLVAFIEGNQAISEDLWFTTDGIQFDSGKATIRPESAAQINDIAEILKAYPKVKIKIGGYTDNTGKANTNKKLSNDRAIAVKNAIVSKDLPADRIDAEGFGSEHPLASNETPEGRQQNRRIDVKVTEK
jgi:OmpA-OmpF porin, OOP family